MRACALMPSECPLVKNDSGTIGTENPGCFRQKDFRLSHPYGIYIQVHIVLDPVRMVLGVTTGEVGKSKLKPLRAGFSANAHYHVDLAAGDKLSTRYVRLRSRKSELPDGITDFSRQLGESVEVCS